jgi:hypothetical protein
MHGMLSRLRSILRTIRHGSIHHATADTQPEPANTELGEKHVDVNVSYSGDAPIQSPEYDRFSRAPFARVLPT